MKFRNYLILLAVALLMGGCNDINATLPGGGAFKSGELLNKVSFKSAYYSNKKTGEELLINGYGDDQTEALASLNQLASTFAPLVPAALPLLLAKPPATQPALHK